MEARNEFSGEKSIISCTFWALNKATRAVRPAFKPQPSPNPISPPRNVIVRAYVKSCWKICFLSAPTALRMPISRVRWATTKYMIFITPRALIIDHYYDNDDGFFHSNQLLYLFYYSIREARRISSGNISSFSLFSLSFLSLPISFFSFCYLILFHSLFLFGI